MSSKLRLFCYEFLFESAIAALTVGITSVSGNGATAITPTPLQPANKGDERSQLIQQLTTETLAQAPNPEGDPNRDRLLQPAPVPVPLPPSESPIVPPLIPEPSPVPSAQPIRVQKIRVTGSTIFTATQLNSITRKVEGRTVTLAELRGVANAISQLYLDRGFITSRAIVGAQEIKDGIVEISVIEGKLERIDVEGTRRLDSDYVRSRIRLGAKVPLNSGKLEDQLRLLRTDPLFKSVEASIRPGSGVGQSILVVRVTEANPLLVRLSADNYSPPSVGSERLAAQLGYRNLTGKGDAITASYYHTTNSGADVFDFSYQVPLNSMDGTLELHATPNRNKVTQPPFDIFDIRGESDLYEISYRQPLVRSPREEFALSLGFTFQDGQTFTFAGPTPFGLGPDAEGNSRTRTIKFGQDYVHRDLRGAWVLRSLLSLGIDIFDATTNSDAIPDGRFLSWLAQVQRVQRLSNSNFLIAQADLQLTPDGLLPSQQFIIGGGQSVRGYRQNVRAGDSGVRFSLEDRITLQQNAAGDSTIQLAPFFDLAAVWNVSDNPNSLQRQKFLAGVGLGLLWQPLPNFNIRLDYGVPLVELNDRGENAQDEGFYFSVSYQN